MRYSKPQQNPFEGFETHTAILLSKPSTDVAGGYTYDGSYSAQTLTGTAEQFEHGEEHHDAVLDNDMLSKVDNSLSARELNRELALLYARGRAELLERKLAENENAKNELLEEHRSPEYEEIFRKFMKGLPEGATEKDAKEKLVKNAEDISLVMVGKEVLDSTRPPFQFYTDMQIELKVAATRLGREDIGRMRLDDLREATSMFLSLVEKAALKYRVQPIYDREKLPELIGQLKKAADSCADCGYA